MTTIGRKTGNTAEGGPAHCKETQEGEKSGALWELGRGKSGEVIECIRLAGVRSGAGGKVGEGWDSKWGMELRIERASLPPVQHLHSPHFGSVALILAQRLVGPSLRAS